MVEISYNAQRILDGLDQRYASRTYRKFYGRSPYRNWQRQINELINSLDNSTDLGKHLSLSTDWGDIIYSRLRSNK